MSNGMRRINMHETPGAAMQNPANRSTDPTPLKDPSGYVNEVPRVRMKSFLGSTPLKDAVILSASSALGYDGINYLYHKVAKPSPTDPNAIKEFKMRKWLTGGAYQMGASLASIYTSDAIGGYMPTAHGSSTYLRPLITGVYKTGIGMIMKKKPTLASGAVDFVMSAAADIVGPAAVYFGMGAMGQTTK